MNQPISTGIIAILFIFAIFFAQQMAAADAVFFMIPPGYGTVFPANNGVSMQSIEKHRSMLLPIGASATINMALAVPVYQHMVNSWGAPDGRFHIKHDWTGDNLALNDEISHLFVSYRLTRYLSTLYDQLGFSTRTGRIIGMVETAFIVTAVEYPIDAYNPDQGLGLSDLFFDYAGIGMAYLKMTNPDFARWDIKTSLRSIGYNNRNILGDEEQDFDNYLYWVTYDFAPVVCGIGYGTIHPEPYNVDAQFFLGVGTTLPDFLGLFSSKLAGLFRWADIYFINLRYNFLTLD